MESREQLIERFLEDTFTVKELKEISGAIERIFTPKDVEEIMGSEMQHYFEFVDAPKQPIEKRFDTKGKSLFQIAREIKVARELEEEIDDWKRMGFTARFIIDKDVKCILDPHPSINSEPIVAVAHLNDEDEFNEDIGCLIAILKAGYDDEYRYEILSRGLEFIFNCKL